MSRTSQQAWVVTAFVADRTEEGMDVGEAFELALAHFHIDSLKVFDGREETRGREHLRLIK